MVTIFCEAVYFIFHINGMAFYQLNYPICIGAGLEPAHETAALPAELLTLAG
jgi:hypothetical protein